MAIMFKYITIFVVIPNLISSQGSETEGYGGNVLTRNILETDKEDDIFQKLVEYADYEMSTEKNKIVYEDRSEPKSTPIQNNIKRHYVSGEEEHSYLRGTETSNLREHIVHEPEYLNEKQDDTLKHDGVFDFKSLSVGDDVQNDGRIVQTIDPTITYSNQMINSELAQNITDQLYEQQSDFSQRNQKDVQLNRKVRQSSLVFVFDATGSMSDDLEQLQKGAAMILEAMLERDDKSIANYVLVPYRDPEYGPVTITTNHTEFKEQLHKIETYGGGDCPESSLTAIIAALNASLPQSYIYVFTDATSGDHVIVNSVLDLIQRKQSQIVFVLTGDCDDRDKPSYQVYEQISIASSGQIFNLSKTDVYKVLKFVNDTLDGRRVNLGSITNEKGYNHTHKVAVDETLKQVTVSVAGRLPLIKITNPAGHEVKGPPKVVPSLDLEQIKVINIINPEPGKWTVTVGSEDEHSVRVSGVSELNFQHGFSVQKTSSMSETSHRPLQGAENYLLIDISSADADSVKLDYAEVLSVNGTTLFEVALAPIEQRSGVVLYGTDSFIPPETFFYLAINGKDKNGNALRRIGSTAVQPQLPEKPFLTLPQQLEARIHQDVVLTCEVESLVPVSVWWLRDNKPLMEKAARLQSAVVEYVIQDIGEKDEGNYKCVALNTAGSAHAFVTVTLKGEPPLIEMSPQNVTLSPGKSMKIDCVVKSNLPLVSFHMLRGDNKTEELQTSSLIMSEGVTKYSYNIKNIRAEKTRLYKCVASNKAGRIVNSTRINILDSIKLWVNPAQTTLHIHTEAKLICSAIRANRIHWLRENKTKISREDINIRDNRVRSVNLLLGNVTYADDGVWVCRADRSDEIVTAQSIVMVVSKPTITMEAQKNMIVQLGSELSVDCRVEAKPKPNITWEDIQGNIIKTKVTTSTDNPHQYISTLHIGDMTIDKGGEYICKAENEFGRVSDHFNVLPQQKIQIIEKPKDTSIKIYTSGHIVCNVTSYPSSTISWLHNDTELSGETETLLTIWAMALTVAGNYTCVARNKYEMSKFDASVNIVGLEYPVIAGDNTSISVNEGESLEILCRLQQGKPYPTMRWEFEANNRSSVDITNLASDNVDTLLIRAVRLHDEGRYTCVAENILGINVRHILVNVLFPPKFLDPAVSDTVTEVISGQKVELQCKVTGKPEPLTVWYKDEMPISFSGAIYISKNTSLVISAARPHDAGKYRCQATNALGEVEKTHTLHVWVRPTLDEWSDAPVLQVVEGQVVVLPCSGRGVPTPTIQWTHNNHLLYVENSLRFVAKFNDSGTYRCIASNDAGNASREFQLTVFVPPSINRPDDEMLRVKMATNASLYCDVSGYPLPHIKWYHNGQALEQNSTDVSFSTTGKLEITNASQTNVGWYTCHAESEVGLAQKNFQIILKEKPKLASEDIPAFIELITGDSLKLPCRATGNPEPNIVWKKDEQHIAQGSHYKVDSDGTLNIMLATVSLTGNYTCNANNTEGHDYKTFTVQVLSTPTLNQADQHNTDVIAVEGETIVLYCPIWEADKLAVKWYKDAELVYDSTNSATNTLVFGNVSRYNQSVYSCVGSNRAGQVAATLSLTVHWPPKLSSHLSFQESNQSSYLSFNQFPDKSSNQSFNLSFNQSSELSSNLSSNQITSIEGADVTLDCKSDANPEAETRWSKDSQMLHDTLPILEIKNAKVYHSGNYACLVRNALGNATRHFNVIILVLPSIEGSENVNVTLRVGDNATLKCNVEGFPTPATSWIYNNADWSIDGTNLISGNITHQSGGTFKCTAGNAVGFAEKKYRVAIISKPVMKEILLYEEEKEPITVSDDMSVKVDTNISISCSARGLPLPKVHWIHNGESLESDGSRMGIANATIRGLETYLGGKYTCIAHNDAGVDGRDIQLNVLVPPKISVYIKNDFTLRKSSEYNTSKTIDVMKGEPFQLPCKAEGNPIPTLSWYKDGHILNTSYDIVIKHMGQLLSIGESRIEHSGNYTCVASNTVGIDNGTHVVRIFSPPKTTTVFNPTTYETVIQGRDVYMECLMVAYPVPTVRWFKHPYINIQTGYQTRFHIYENNTLKIKNVTLEDEGKYSCIGTNQVGVSELTYKLEILAPATIRPWVIEKEDIRKHERQDLVVAKIRSGFSLFCDAFGYPEPMVAWLKSEAFSQRMCGLSIQPSLDGVPLYESSGTLHLSMDGRHLTVIDALPSDAGTYTCVTQNRVGNDYKEYTVKVVVPAVWGAWSDWSACSVSCGRGVSIRRRRCHYPEEGTLQGLDDALYQVSGEEIQNGLKKTDKMECQGSNVEQRACRIMPCQQDTLPHQTFVQSPKRMETVQGFSNPDVFRNIQTEYDEDYRYPAGQEADEKDLWEVEMSVAGTLPENQGRNSMVYVISNHTQSNAEIKAPSVLRKTNKQNGCPLGYRNDITTGKCEDINECLLEKNGCHLTQMCENLPGDYRCLCQEGYTSSGPGQRCLDLDECTLDIHGCAYRCVNVPGSYRCVCPDHLVMTAEGTNCVQP